MLAEFIDKIRYLSDNASEVKVVHVPGVGRKVWLVQSGQSIAVDIPPKAREIAVGSVASLVEIVKDEAIAPNPEVYHDAGHVTVLLDRMDRHETARMDLGKSDQFILVEGISSRKWPVRDAIMLLRAGLHDAGADSVLSALRRVDFSRTSAGHVAVEHGKESLGRSVEAKVQQADQIPSEFTVEVPVYRNEGLAVITMTPVTLALTLLPEEGAVSLRPLAGHLSEAMNAVHREIHDKLTAELPGVQVIRGTP